MIKSYARRRRAVLRQGQSGAALVESVSGLVVLIPLVVASILIIVSVGTFMIYKIKVGFVANQAAQYASGLCSWQSSYIQYPASWGAQTATAELNQAAADICQATGLPAPAAGSQFVTLADNGGKRIQCVVNMTGFIQPFGANTPVQIPMTISDIASVDVTADQPPCILELHPQNPGTASNYDVAIPCYGVFTPSTTPQWNIINGQQLKPPWTVNFAFSGNWAN